MLSVERKHSHVYQDYLQTMVDSGGYFQSVLEGRDGTTHFRFWGNKGETYLAAFPVVKKAFTFLDYVSALFRAL